MVLLIIMEMVINKGLLRTAIEGMQGNIHNIETYSPFHEQKSPG